MVTHSATVTMESLSLYRTTIALSNGAIADPLRPPLPPKMGVPYAPKIREWPYLCNRWSDPLHVWFYGRVFGDGRSNGAISGSNNSRMASAILEKFQMAISPQRLTIYLYSAQLLHWHWR